MLFLNVVGAAGTTILQPLRVLQNRAMRIIFRASRYTRLDHVYLNLRVLKLDDLYKLTIAKFMHQYYHGTLPDQFSGLLFETNSLYHRRLRSSSTSTYRSVRCKKTNTQRSIRHIGPKIWNEVPDLHRNESNFNFKRHYTNLRLANY